MKSRLKADLVELMEKFISEVYPEPREGLIYPEMAQYMADAAEVVFDSGMASSIWTEHEVK